MYLTSIFSPAFNHSADDNDKDKLLIIQCDSGHLYGNLIACARYRIDDEREKSLLQRRSNYCVTHVLFIVHLPRKELECRKGGSSFVGFKGGSWISSHIDDIRPPAKEELSLDQARSASISELFYSMPFVSSAAITMPSKESNGSEETNMSLEEIEKKGVGEEMHVEDIEHFHNTEESLNDEVTVLEALAMETEKDSRPFDKSANLQEV